MVKTNSHLLKFGFGIMMQKKCLSSIMYTLNINSVGNWIKFNKSRGLQYLTQRWVTKILSIATYQLLHKLHQMLVIL